MDFKIRAFGACMIGGFPHRYEDSCFHLATERLRKATGHHVIASSYTLGGFPVTRVLKDLPSRCLASQPDIVVLQFASSDLIVPVRRKHHRHQVDSVGRKVSSASANVVHQLRWGVRGILGDLLQLPPVTAPEIYLETMNRMIRAVAEKPAIPVLLSPFVFGGHRSDRLARECAARLRQVVAVIPSAHYVDVYTVLNHRPRHQMLLSDGTHLSLQGQAMVGDCLFAALAKIVRAETR